MKNTEMIKKNYEFRNFLKKGTYISGKLLEVLVLQPTKGKKLGIAVGKKAGGSVQRNQIKRYIREAYKDVEEKIISDTGLLIIWKKTNDYNDASYDAIKNDLENILRKKRIID